MDSELLATILGRNRSLFSVEMSDNDRDIRAMVAGSRILVIGAAGSIGAAFVKQLIPFRPATLHLVDPSENNLVELVRDLRSSNIQPPDDFRTLAIAMGDRSFDRFLASQPPYDHLLNFAAMKHVRGERDPHTLMRMVEINLFHLERTLRGLTATPPRGFFSVSSDKAVNPENAMGATKAFMEAILWHFSDRIPCTSARFANVAFSDGSLLYGFYRRFEKGQPLSAPLDVKRYFISHEEAGQLCLLAAFLGNNREVFIPRLDPTADLLTFSHIAQRFIESRGYQPRIFDDEAEARAFAAGMKPADRQWPCCFTVSDTTGEKPFEEFHATGDRVDFDRFHRVGVVRVPPFDRSQRLMTALNTLMGIRDGETWRCRDIIEALKIVVPTLCHRDRGRDLDQKM